MKMTQTLRTAGLDTLRKQVEAAQDKLWDLLDKVDKAGAGGSRPDNKNRHYALASSVVTKARDLCSLALGMDEGAPRVEETLKAALAAAPLATAVAGRAVKDPAWAHGVLDNGKVFLDTKVSGVMKRLKELAQEAKRSGSLQARAYIEKVKKGL